MKTYHVAKNGSDYQKGTREEPFLTISKAAKEARSGDQVIVHEGEYREWVRQNMADAATRNGLYIGWQKANM